MEPYKVALIQSATHVIVDPARRDELINRNLDRTFELAQWAKNRMGNVRLVALPEYSIIGQFRPRSVDEWIELAETVPGPATKRIGKEAKRLGVYFAGNVYERDPAWPGLLWNTSFIIDDSGEVVLKYRKHNGPNNLNSVYAGPGDVLSDYIEKHGEDSVFPVVDTPLGVLGVMSCTDLIFPEMARSLALNGAEVLLHLSAEPWADIAPMWDVFRRARAYENLCFLLSACSGAFLGSDRPEGGYRGHSQIINHLGTVVSHVPNSGEAVCVGEVDVNAIREVRTRKPGDSGHEWNQLVELRSDLFSRVYSKANRWPTDHWHGRRVESTAEPREVARALIDRLVEEEKLKLPEY